MCVVGNQLFRVYKYTDALKLNHQTKTDRNISTAAWIDDTLIAAGTADSKIILIKNGECVLEMSYVLPHLDLSSR